MDTFARTRWAPHPIFRHGFRTRVDLTFWSAIGSFRPRGSPRPRPPIDAHLLSSSDHLQVHRSWLPMMVVTKVLRGGVARRSWFERSIHNRPTKSTTCFGRATGLPLTEYASQADAHEGAVHANARSGSEWLSPYLCSACGCWHLAPRHGRPSSMPCACTDSHGRSKALWTTWRDAQRTADILRSETGTQLAVYECELGLGWHLTKQLLSWSRRR
jgi:hypothetical protein